MTTAAERRIEGKNILELLKNQCDEIIEESDKGKHDEEIATCLAKSPLNNLRSGDFLEIKAKKKEHSGDQVRRSGHEKSSNL